MGSGFGRYPPPNCGLQTDVDAICLADAESSDLAMLREGKAYRKE
jgi:hypothetical protein